MATWEDIRTKLLLPLQIFIEKITTHIFKKYFLKAYHVHGESSRLKIAKSAVVNNATFNLSSGNIVIEDYVFFGSNVSVITGTHDITKTGLERQHAFPTAGRDIIIKRGTFVASNATILGPCTIGENAVIGACCLLREDVPANTFCYTEHKNIILPLSKPKVMT